MNKKIVLSLLLIMPLISSCNNSGQSKTSETSSTTTTTTSTTTTTTTSKKEKTIDDCNTTDQIIKYAGLGYQKIIEDNNFKTGFKLTKTINQGDPYYSEKINLYEKFKSNTPIWTMAQWGSKYDLGSEDYKYVQEDNNLIHTIKGHKEKQNVCKKAIFNSETGSIYMELNASEDYDHPRLANESWPAFLLSQSKTEATKLKLSPLKSLVVDVNYKITKCDKKMSDEEYVESRHTAQCVLFLTVQNRTVGHVDYGKYIWFGFNLFDYRTMGQEFPGGTQLDKGTGRMIYKTSSKDTMKDTNGKQPLINQEGHCNFDMIDEAKKSMEEAIKQGYLTTSTWDDMYIGGFNFGFENPGTFDIGCEFSSINFFYK